jgi:hypothetical protein
VQVSESGAGPVLPRLGLNRLPAFPRGKRHERRRKRHGKQWPGLTSADEYSPPATLHEYRRAA